MKVPLRLELPQNLSTEQEGQILAALQRGLDSLDEADDLLKSDEHAHEHDAGTSPHRFIREKIEKTKAIYERQMAKMIEEIQAVILA